MTKAEIYQIRKANGRYATIWNGSGDEFDVAASKLLAAGYKQVGFQPLEYRSGRLIKVAPVASFILPAHIPICPLKCIQQWKNAAS